MKHARLPLVLVLLLAAVAAPAWAQRLPDVARPEHYTLWFAPDLQNATFRGRETIRVQIVKPTPVIMLHAAEIAFGTVKITAGGATQEAKVALQNEAETATLTVPKPLAAGAASIEITYTGILNDKLRGFYLSKANGRSYAVSQMEATDARRAFPSFDEPAYKATFDVSLMIDEKDTAISNGAQKSDAPGPETGKHTVTFATTKKMSTYLVALVVGDFVCREGAADGIPVRICSTPDKKALTGFALDAAVQQIAFYNHYFGITYPFEKLDIIGVPDFAAGAMENAGAITFREQYLLADPQTASLGTKKNVAAILSHEIAHQWFGDLVTMQWWDDIWLNEGFATWAANKPLAAWRPDWHVEWDDVEETQKAMGLDALKATRSIRTKVETPEQINEVFDAIAYEKSAAVLRMIEAYIGPDAFQRGVSSYLKKYSYGNAKAESFWTEMTAVSGKPVDKIMASFVDQPGVPVLRAATTCKGESTAVTVQQDRFMGVAGATAPSQVWTLPVCTRTKPDGTPQCEVVSRREQTFTVQGCAKELYLNAGSKGYFITQYPADTVQTLTGTVDRALTSTERVGFLGDEWWMTRSGRHYLATFLDLSAALAADPTPAITEGIGGRLAYAAEYLVEPGDRPRFDGWLKAKFGPALSQLGFPGKPGDDEQTQTRRAFLFALLGGTGDDKALQAKARELVTTYMADPTSLPGTLAGAVVGVAARGGDAALYDQYLARVKVLSADPEAYYRYFSALTDFRDPALVDRTLKFAITPEVRTQDASFLIGGEMARPWGREAAWTFIKQEWQTLTDRLGVFQGLPAIVGATENFCSAEDAADVKQFFAAHPIPSADRTLHASIERIEGCTALRQRQAPALKPWLATNATH
jgi:aminopeptidase N